MYPLTPEILNLYRQNSKLWDFRIEGATLGLSKESAEKIKKLFNTLLDYGFIAEEKDYSSLMLPATDNAAKDWNEYLTTNKDAPWPVEFREEKSWLR